MNKKNKKNLIFMEEFHNICVQNKLWYSLDNQTLLQTYENQELQKFNKDKYKLQVMITINTLYKLKKLFPERIIDSNTNKYINNLCVYFSKKKYQINKKNLFIEMRILIPTTVVKIKKFQSFIFYWKHKLFFKKNMNLNLTINHLYDPKFQGYLLLKNRKQNLQFAWIQALSFKRYLIKFQNYDFFILKERDIILNIWFKKINLNKNKYNYKMKTKIDFIHFVD